jgi:hypothetical protein
MEEIEFGLYKKGEEEQILSLFHSVFPKIPRNFSEWQWEYERGPFAPPIIALAHHEHRVIGQEALFFVPMKCGSREFLGAQSVDTMTDLKFRGKGIFKKLAFLTLEEGERRKAPLFYGFPNRNSYEAYVKKLGWQDVGRIHRYIKVLDLSSALKARLKNPLLCSILGKTATPLLGLYFWGTGKKDQRFRLEKVERFDSTYDNFWKSLRDRFPIMVDRTSQYMNWRYLEHPSGEYQAYFLKQEARIAGVAVIRLVQLQYPLGSIGEFFVEGWNEATARVFLTMLLELFKFQKAAIVASWFVPHSPYISAFKKLGFRLRSKHQSVIAISPDGSLEKSELSRFDNWYITSGDYDMF